MPIELMKMSASHVAVEDRDPPRMGVLQPVGSTKVQGQLCVAVPQEDARRVARELTVRAEDEDAQRIERARVTFSVDWWFGNSAS